MGRINNNFLGEIFMNNKFSVSATQGKVAFEHDNRKYTPKNADMSLRSRNVTIKSTDDYKSAYNNLFRNSIEAYNNKQKRNDRKKSFDYYSDTLNSKGHEKPIYEYVFQIGNNDDLGVTDTEFDYNHWVDLKKNAKFKSASKYVEEHLNKDPNREKLKEILIDVMSRLENKYPKFHFFTIQAHDDEPGGTLHFHVAFTPVADNYKSGMSVRNSLSKALAQMGFKTDKEGYGIQKWQNEVKNSIEDAMVQAGYERQYMNNNERHLSVYQYKIKKANEKLTSENETLAKTNELLQGKYNNLMSDSKSLLSTVSMITKRKNELDEREELLNEREDELNEREDNYNKLDIELDKRQSELNDYFDALKAKEAELNALVSSLNRPQQTSQKNYRLSAEPQYSDKSKQPRRLPDISNIKGPETAAEKYDCYGIGF